ncbi:MAG TPA: chloride channel protein [Candidatus Binatia bacterium]|nr:chloride channel protein [Candidatus Binatia bacterium]
MRKSAKPHYPLLRKYLPVVHQDLSATYSRNLHKWLIIAPIIGVITGLGITGIAVLVLRIVWPVTVDYFLHHVWAIIPIVTVAFAVTGLIMQFLTPDPNEHSTEEIVKSYHEHQGDIDMRPFFAKLFAAVTTVGFGGSAALEGPSIYGGGGIGSWLWTKMGRFRLTPRDRRIMLISGAAAGMAAVFRAPLTGLVFALEMPYKDDLAHEALLPSLIASVVAFVTLASFMGAQPIFDFGSARSFTGKDLIWCALLGAIIGLIGMVFSITFRHARSFFVKWAMPHWIKLTVGGFLTGLCGVVFVLIFRDGLIPMGPNYEAVGLILGAQHSGLELVLFAVFKLAATLFSLASGGVSAMFVPLFLSGGALGTAFGQVLHSGSVELYAAVGMAAFIAAGYKTPLAAVTFIAEATGGHAFIIPAVIGSAVAYAVSGDASVSGDQRLHEGVRVHDLREAEVGQIMQRDIISVPASLNLREFEDTILKQSPHSTFPVMDGARVVGTISERSLIDGAERHPDMTVGDAVNREVRKIPRNCDAMEALRLLLAEDAQPMLLVTNRNGKLEGIVTKSDLLEALKIRGEEAEPELEEAADTATPM